MQYHATRNSTGLMVRISGPLDAQHGPLLVDAIDHDLRVRQELVVTLDLVDCDYVSSAGLRAVLAIHGQQTKAGGRLTVKNASDFVYRIFETTGLTRILEVARCPRSISIEGLELISAGSCGECYRIDQERIVKLYYDGVDAAVAEQEKRFAREALIMGIPTAISYDVVTCGARTGVVYELLNSELLSTVIGSDLDQLDRHARTLVAIARRIHTAIPGTVELPDIKQRLAGHIEQIGIYVPSDDVAFLRNKLALVPDADTCVHFDLHSSNIMMQDGEPMIIDLGDLSRGSWQIDLGVMYAIYGVPELGICERATKIPTAKGVELWNLIEQHYFADEPDDARQYFHQNRYFLASLRLVYAITFLPSRRERFLKLLTEFLLPRMRESE